MIKEDEMPHNSDPQERRVLDEIANQIPDVQRQRAGRRLLVDDNRHRTAFNAVAEGDAAAAGQTRVSESLQHPAAIITRGLQQFLDLGLEGFLRGHAAQDDRHEKGGCLVVGKGAVGDPGNEPFDGAAVQLASIPFGANEIDGAHGPPRV